MKALDRKLLRDLWHLRGQVLAIAAVIMGGVATLVMSLSTYDSLVTTRDRFYSEYRFAEVFANLKRAPVPVAERLRAIPGVAHLETRVIAGVKLEVENFTDPITGMLLAIVGFAVSPEYVYQIAPGAMFPDFKRYGVLWMGRNALAAAYDVAGAFKNCGLVLHVH